MARATCAGDCKRTFAGVGAFDKHHSIDQSQGGYKVICHDPQAVGLVYRGNGVWGEPVPADVNFPKAKATAPKVYECACGNKFQGTGKRGRPPASCTDCGGKGVKV